MHKRAPCLPLISWLSVYPWQELRVDLAAGLIASTVVIPKAMACAVIAGLPIVTGLYTALAGMAVYPFLGTSSVLSVTSTTTIALMTATAIAAANLGAAGAGAQMAAGATIAFLVGVYLILARVLRLGFVANFISKPVLVGFEAGIGVAIAVTQLKSVLGVHLTSKTTLGTLRELPGILPQTHGVTLCVGLAGIAILVVLPRVLPRVSAPLVLVGVSALATSWFGLGGLGVQLVGAVPKGLPSFAWPDFSLVNSLWPAALGIALMSFTESVASSRTFIRREDPAIDANQELAAIGAANIAAAVIGGFPAGGGASQTAINFRSGARSQMAQFVGALMVVACFFFLSRAIGFLPQATLGALVLVVAISMIKPEKFRAIGRVRRDELWWAWVTMASIIFIGILQGILVAVAISVLTLLYQANHPPVYAVAHNPEKNIFRRLGENTKDVTYPGLLILRTEGRLTFANAPFVADKMRALLEEFSPRVIILECSAIPDIEYTALVMLTEAQERLHARGVTLWLAALNPDLFKIIGRSPLGGILGRKGMFFDLAKALEAYRGREGEQ
jgi:sulfate permease, SulP family